MRNAGLDEAQAGIKIPGRNINNFRYTDDYHPYGRKWRGTKEPLDESERGEWKSWLKTQHSEKEDHGIQSHHFMANRWGNNGNSDRFYLGAPKPLQMLTAAMKLRLSLLRRKAMTNLDSILTSRDITLPTKVHLIKAMVFPVVMYGCESWSIRKHEELMLLNCGVGEDSWKSLGLQGDPTSQS